jgi:hypothetical protein
LTKFPSGTCPGAADPSGQYERTPQVCGALETDPSGQYEPAAHRPEQCAAVRLGALPYRPAEHAVHSALPVLSANVPGLHAVFVPLQRLPRGHSVQRGALELLEYLPSGQARQRPGVDNKLSASYVPGMHGCFTSQNGWLELSWNLPVGQPVQPTTLLRAENLPMSQPVHSRSTVLPGRLSTRSPATHCTCLEQNVWPGRPWNLPSAQMLQLAEFDELE